MSKYKYYWKKPKGEIAKDIVRWLAISGVVAVAATSPFFITGVIKACFQESPYRKRSLASAFRKLKKDGCIIMHKKRNQIYISLTEKGKKKAGWMQIDHLVIKKPKKWDKKWRLLIFDIEEKNRPAREALRGLIKRLGFYPLQKSVWAHQFDCRDEVYLLRDFFGLSSHEIRLVVTDYLEDDTNIKKYF